MLCYIHTYQCLSSCSLLSLPPEVARLYTARVRPVPQDGAKALELCDHALIYADTSAKKRDVYEGTFLNSYIYTIHLYLYHLSLCACYCVLDVMKSLVAICDI